MKFRFVQEHCTVFPVRRMCAVLGVSLGAVTVAAYALCTQLAQPIYGFAASGLHFLFPHLAEHRGGIAANPLVDLMLPQGRVTAAKKKAGRFLARPFRTR